MSSLDENLHAVFSHYERWGSIIYEGEPVTQLEHALQAAQLAEQAKAAVPTIIAALLHDIGHLVSMDRQTEETWALKNHGEVGELFLTKHGFPKEVTEVVCGHVNAKRYLVFKHQSYFETLSSHSRYTLKLQGGPMSEDEARQFEKHPQFEEIIRVREWDEEAKESEKKTHSLNYYRNVCQNYLTQLQ